MDARNNNPSRNAAKEETMEKIRCKVPGCGSALPSDRMWAIRKQNGELAEICGACAHEARVNGVRVDRLGVALARSSFFQAFKKAGVIKRSV